MTNILQFNFFKYVLIFKVQVVAVFLVHPPPPPPKSSQFSVTCYCSNNRIFHINIYFVIGWLAGWFVCLFIYFHLFLLHHFQENCDPYFLTTVVFPEGAVNDMTRLKLAVFDVRDREKEEVCVKHVQHEECTDHLAFAETSCWIENQ